MKIFCFYFYQYASETAAKAICTPLLHVYIFLSLCICSFSSPPFSRKKKCVSKLIESVDAKMSSVTLLLLISLLLCLIIFSTPTFQSFLFSLHFSPLDNNPCLHFTICQNAMDFFFFYGYILSIWMPFFSFQAKKMYSDVVASVIFFSVRRFLQQIKGMQTAQKKKKVSLIIVLKHMCRFF